MNIFPVIILAGGLATRLHPITEKIPKALVSVGMEPFIVHQLRLLHSYGIRRVVISAWYKGHMIQDFIGDGQRFGMQIDFVFDGDTPLGTGGAARKAMNHIEGPFFVLYGDSYLACDYKNIQAFFEKDNQPGLMTVYRNLDKWDSSNVEMVDHQILNYDKNLRTPNMQFIDYGLGIFRPEAFAHLREDQPADLADIYQNLIRQHRLMAYEVKNRFYEIGSITGLNELDELLTQDPYQFLDKE
jgi:N-acetyl-alpha-D-muramate 1-phosphate uridylyltransferase